MQILRPSGLLAGFFAGTPDAAVPELLHAGEQWAGGDYFIPHHAHPVWEFYLQLDGESRWEGPKSNDRAQTYTLRAGDFFAVAPGVTHQMHERPTRRHHFLFVAFDLEATLQRVPELRPIWEAQNVINVPHAESLIPSFRQLIREVSVGLPHRAAALRLALDYLVVEASRVVQNAGGTSLIASHPAVARAKELLDYQPARDWRLNDLAHLTGLSPGHLASAFARDVGVPPRRYLLQVRVERAKELLQNSDVPITQLALELGFSSSQHFAATFRRLTGSSAQSFRQKNKQDK